MKILYSCLNLKRPLICYLPIAFQNFKNVKNNIGLMWLSFEDKDTIEIIEKKSDSPNGAQYSALKKLLTQLKSEYKIKYVLGHKDIAPGRKDDPWNFEESKIK